MPTWRLPAAEKPLHPLLILGWFVAPQNILQPRFHHEHLSPWASTVIKYFWKHTLVFLEAMQRQGSSCHIEQIHDTGIFPGFPHQVMSFIYLFMGILKLVQMKMKDRWRVKVWFFNFCSRNHFEVTLQESWINHYCPDPPSCTQMEWAMWQLKAAWRYKMNGFESRTWLVSLMSLFSYKVTSGSNSATFLLGDLHKPPGHASGQPALGGPTWAGGWSRWPPKVLANSNHSVILLFCDYMITLCYHVSSSSHGHSQIPL